MRMPQLLVCIVCCTVVPMCCVYGAKARGEESLNPGLHLDVRSGVSIVAVCYPMGNPEFSPQRHMYDAALQDCINGQGLGSNFLYNTVLQIPPQLISRYSGPSHAQITSELYKYTHAPRQTT